MRRDTRNGRANNTWINEQWPRHLAAVERLGALVETTSNAVVNESLLEALLQGVHEVHLATGRLRRFFLVSHVGESSEGVGEARLGGTGLKRPVSKTKKCFFIR